MKYERSWQLQGTQVLSLGNFQECRFTTFLGGCGSLNYETHIQKTASHDSSHHRVDPGLCESPWVHVSWMETPHPESPEIVDQAGLQNLSAISPLQNHLTVRKGRNLSVPHLFILEGGNRAPMCVSGLEFFGFEGENFPVGEEPHSSSFQKCGASPVTESVSQLRL